MTLHFPEPLLSADRIDTHGQKAGSSSPAGERTPFERDWDRIVFSQSFRRLNLKTQVFPFPERDAVHTRLTHSLEVAAIGRSLGNQAAQLLTSEGLLPEDLGAYPGSVVAAACLMHDIGNPPFGHSGESSIREYFVAHGPDFSSKYGLDLPQELLSDLQNFNGNAQGLRTVTRLEMEERDGMRLTAAVLGTFMKYPSDTYSPKLGFFSSERDAMKGVASSLGLHPTGSGFSRHPLNLLVEAADDLSYVLLDLEDGVHLGLVPPQQASELLKNFITAVQDAGLDAPAADSPPESPHMELERVAYFRALAMGNGISAVMDAFSSHLEEILAYKPIPPLLGLVPQEVHDAFEEVRTFTVEHCYRSEQVLALEMLGHEVISFMLDLLIPLAPNSLKSMNFHKRNVFDTHLGRYRQDWDEWTPEERVRRIVDYVSSMTDRQILFLYRRARGIASPPSWL